MLQGGKNFHFLLLLSHLFKSVNLGRHFIFYISGISSCSSRMYFQAKKVHQCIQLIACTIYEELVRGLLLHHCVIQEHTITSGQPCDGSFICRLSVTMGLSMSAGRQKFLINKTSENEKWNCNFTGHSKNISHNLYCLKQ